MGMSTSQCCCCSSIPPDNSAIQLPPAARIDLAERWLPFKRNWIQPACGHEMVASPLMESKASPAASTSFSCLHYNILGDCNVDPAFFAGVDPACLQWDCRRIRLKKEILSYNCDLLSLCELDHYEDNWRGEMDALGFDSFFEPRLGKKDGSALFWKRNKFECVRKDVVRFEDGVGRIALLAHMKLKKSAAADTPAPPGAVSPTPTPTPEGSGGADEFIVASTHLYWDARSQLVILGEMHQLLCAMAAFSQQMKSPAFLLLGDMNSAPSSPVCALAARAGLCSVYAHSKPAVSLRNEALVDYIFHSSGLVPSHVLDMPTHVAFPSAQFPSDHLAIGARLALVPQPAESKLVVPAISSVLPAVFPTSML